MNSQELANRLIEAFNAYSKESVINMTRSSKIVQETLIKYYGNSEYSHMTEESVQEWNDAWRLFEKHYKIIG